MGVNLFYQITIMSAYYNIDGKKLRISDHEPNTRLNGTADIHFYTVDACGNKMSIGAQIDAYCDKHDMEITAFADVIRAYADTDEECGYMLIELNRK